MLKIELWRFKVMSRKKEYVEEKLLPLKVSEDGSLYVEGVKNSSALSIEIVNKKVYLNCIIHNEYISEDDMLIEQDDDEYIDTENPSFYSLGNGGRRKLKLQPNDEEEYPYVNDYDRTELTEIFKK